MLLIILCVPYNFRVVHFVSHYSNPDGAEPIIICTRLRYQPLKLCSRFFPSVSEGILLLRSPQTPCGYAARANSEGATFSFALVKFVPITENTRLTPLPYNVHRSYFDPIKSTPSKDITVSNRVLCHMTHLTEPEPLGVLMVESSGTAPESVPLSRCFIISKYIYTLPFRHCQYIFLATNCIHYFT